MARTLLAVLALLPCVCTVRIDDTRDPDEELKALEAQGQQPPDDVVPRLCQAALPDETNFWRFMIGYEASKGLDHNQKFTLRPNDDCSGKDLGLVSVIPRIHPEDPLRRSKVVITLQPKDYGRRVFVCRPGPGRAPCVASAQPRARGFRPNRLLLWVPGMAESARVQNLVLLVGSAHRVVDLLEWALLLIILCFLATTLHALYILRFNMRLQDIWGGCQSTATRASTSRTSAVGSSQAAKGRVLEGTEVEAVTVQEAAEDRVAQAEAAELKAASREAAEDEATDPSAPELKMEEGEAAKVETAEGKVVEEAVPPRLCPVDISSPFWESLDALVNSICFVVACVSLLSVVLTILMTAHGHPFLIFIAIGWPCVCGNFMLYCFWMTTCRLQIYSAALSRGICVRGKSTSPSVLAMAGCLFLLLLCVVATVCTLWEAKKGANSDKVKKITPFVINPMSTLLSICVYIYFRILAHSRTQCPTAIDQMVELMAKKEGSGQQAAEPEGPSADGSRLAQLVRLGAVPIVSEGAFCQLCRCGGDPVAAIGAAAEAEEPLAEGRGFSILDLAWHGKMVHTLSGYSVAILNVPVALFFFLVFAGASVWFAIICLTTRPGLSSIYTSENSLGHLVPDFRSWQTDYEFLLDSTAHSATLVGALAQDSTNKLSVTLPDGRHLETYDDLVMATAELDGVTFPTSVGIVAEGIRRQSTRYHLAVVKEYHLIVAVRIVGEDFDRFMRWGEVVGGVITVPGMIDLQVEIYYRSYNMGVPVSEPDARAMSQGGKDLMTVFVPMDNKYNKCWIHCANTDHCLASEIGVTGCFFVYGFGNASLFHRKNFTKNWNARKTTLGVSLCSQRLMGSLECSEMDHITPNILSVKMPKFKPTSQVQRYEFYPYKIFEGRKVMEKKRRIAFSMAAPKPIAVLAMIGQFIQATVDLGSGDIQVVLHKYYPTSDWEVLQLHLAVLVPDKLCSITIPSYVDAKLEYSPPDFSNECRMEAARNKYIEQYSVCGGWRPSTVVVTDVRPWQPQQHVSLNLDLLGKSKSVKIRVRTAGGAQPAEWVVRKHCALDLRSLTPAEASEVLSEQVIHTMTRTCLQMTIQFRCRVWRPDIVEWSQEFLFRHFDANTAIKLFAQADKNPGIKNFTGFYKDVGLTRDGDHLLLSVKTKAERKSMPLDLGYVIQNPRSTGRFAKAACRMARLEDVQVGVLSAAVHRADVSIVRNVVQCIEKRRGHLEPTSSGQHVHPEIRAVQLKRRDLLKEVLKVWPSCISWQDGDRDMERSFTLLELSVAYGCAFCVDVLRSAGLDATRLVFTPSTKPVSWKTSAGRVLKRMGPKRITFSYTSTPLSRILTTLLPIAKAGGMESIEYLSFLYTSQTHSDKEDDPSLGDRLCQLVKASPKLKVLFLGSSMGSIQKAREVLACLHGVQHLEELDLDHHLLLELGQWSEERTRFYTEFILKFPRLRVLHYSALAASQIPASSATLSMLKRRLPRLFVRPDLDVEAVAAFQRSPCQPRPGMKAHVVNTAPKDSLPELGEGSGTAEDSLPELGGAGSAAEDTRTGTSAEAEEDDGLH